MRFSAGSFTEEGIGPPEAVTVQTFLEDPVVRRGGPEILAGGDGVDRRVRWVHISDQPDIADYLRGGEVLLTSGVGLPFDDEGCREYVRSLARVGIAALVVRSEGHSGNIADAIVSEAAEQDLPLIRLNHRIGFVEITRTLHEKLLDRELGYLRRADELRGDLMRLLVENQGMGALTQRIAAALGRAAVVEDAWGQVVSMSWPGHDDDEVLDLWNRRVSVLRRHCAHLESVQIAPGLAWAPLLARGTSWGRLLALDYGPGMSPDEAVILEVGAAALNLVIATQADVRLAGDRARDDLVGELRAKHLTSEERFRRRAASLGMEFSQAPIFGYVFDWPGFRQWAADIGLSEADRREAIEDLRMRIERLLRPWCTAVLAGVCGEQVLGVLQPSQPGQLERHIQTAVDHLITDIGVRWDGAFAVVVGISTQSPMSEACQSLEEAGAAANYATTMGLGQRVQRFTDLRLHRLLSHIAKEGRLAGYVHSQLAPLIERDRGGRSRLIETLRSYLAHNGRATQTAQALFIERRTLYHRLGVIELLLNCDVSSHETRIRLAVALQGLAILEAGGSGAAS